VLPASLLLWLGKLRVPPKTFSSIAKMTAQLTRLRLLTLIPKQQAAQHSRRRFCRYLRTNLFLAAMANAPFNLYFHKFERPP
jgi:hypothetical protein